jgi:MFS family permease
MAMFVLVVDTALMNVSISAVVEDLDTTVSGVQSAIALEALVSAAFILIGSKVADLIGRKRAYVIGLLCYAVGALAMTLARDLLAVIVFWSVIGGLGASLLLPSMQALIHGNFEGAAQRRVYATVGAAAAIAAAIGPLLGGLITRYLSWRVGFLLEALVIGVVLLGSRLVRDAPYTGRREIDAVGAGLSAVGMGGVVLGIIAWQEGVGPVVALIVIGLACLAGLAAWLVHRRRVGASTLIDPDLFRAPLFRIGVSQQLLQQIALGGAMIVLPIFFQIVLEYDALAAGIALAPLSLSMFATAMLVAKSDGGHRPSTLVTWGFALLLVGIVAVVLVVPRSETGWAFSVPLLVAGCGLGLLVSQLNNYTLSPISEARVSEAAGVNSAAGSFGLSFGLAMGGALMMAALASTFAAMTDDSVVLPPDAKVQVADALETDAQLVSNTNLEALLAEQPAAVSDEIVRINTDARPIALQVALLAPMLAAAGGLVNALRMRRLPDPEPSTSGEVVLGG